MLDMMVFAPSSPAEPVAQSCGRGRGVLSQISRPGILVARTPLLESVGPVLLEILAATFIYRTEVLYHLFVIKLSLRGKNARKANMLNVVAHLAKCDKAFQRLYMLFIVIVPPLVTIESALHSADAAAVAILSIHVFAQLVPLGGGHDFAHVGIPARLWHQFNL
jgi:hypothetical protein